MKEMKGMMAELADIVVRAGEVVMRHYEEAGRKGDAGLQIAYKGDDSPLTLADQEGSAYIVGRLKEAFASIPVISEEAALPAPEERQGWERFFLVDPLDGTKEFIKRNGEFTVNVALVERGVPVAGVVGIPAKGLVYTGDREQGAFRMEARVEGGMDGGKVLLGEAERLVSGRYSLGEPARIVVSRSHGDPATVALLEGLGVKVAEEVPSGSSLKFCLVAEGAAELYPRLGPTMEWDTAAADAVWRWSVEPAGEGALQPRWSPLVYNKPDLRNPGFVIGLGPEAHPSGL